MNLTFSPEHCAYRAEVRAWMEANLPENWANLAYRGPDDDAENARIQAEWERALYHAGYSCVYWNKEYGGQGLGLIEHLIVNEEMGRVGAPEGINAIGKGLVGPIITAVGSEEQKLHFLPRIARTDDIWCQGFSEPNAGSDLASLRTRAVKDGDRWIVNGQKIWTSFARHAQWCILLVRTDPDLPRHKGLTIFLLDMKSPGIDVRPLIQITGQREFNEVFLEDVEIPDSMRLGDVNDGWRVAMGVLGHERATTRMYRQQRFVAELKRAMELAKGKVDSVGRPLLESAHWRDRIGRIYARLSVIRLHNLRTISNITNDRDIGFESSALKLFWSEVHQELTELFADLLGEEFLFGNETYPFRDVYLHSRADTIIAGTSEVQRNVISERLVGLAR